MFGKKVKVTAEDYFLLCLRLLCILEILKTQALRVFVQLSQDVRDKCASTHLRTK